MTSHVWAIFQEPKNWDLHFGLAKRSPHVYQYPCFMCSSMNFPARNLHLVQMFPTSLMKIVTFFPDFSGQIPPHGRSADLHPTFAQALKALASPTLAKHFYLWKPPSRVARKISTPLMFEGLNHWKKKRSEENMWGILLSNRNLLDDVGCFTTINSPHQQPLPAYLPSCGKCWRHLLPWPRPDCWTWT